MEKLGNYGF